MYQFGTTDFRTTESRESIQPFGLIIGSFVAFPVTSMELLAIQVPLHAVGHCAEALGCCGTFYTSDPGSKTQQAAKGGAGWVGDV